MLTAQPRTLAPGTILYSTWGYDQTNVTFYSVVKCKGDWVTMVEIAQNEAPDQPLPGGGWSMTGRAVPVPTIIKGEPFRRKMIPAHVQVSSICKGREDYEYAREWDGKPVCVSHTH